MTMVQKGLNVLKYAVGKRVTRGSLANRMRATVQSRMKHGLHVIYNTVKPAELWLQQIQNEDMEIVTGAATPMSCNRYWLGMRNVKPQEIQGMPQSREIPITSSWNRAGETGPQGSMKQA